MAPPDARELDALATHTISRNGLRPDELVQELALLGARWTVTGDELCLVLDGPMRKTGGVAAFAGALADELDHHPKITIEFGKLTLLVHTHNAKSITVLDLVYAARLEQWLRTNAW